MFFNHFNHWEGKRKRHCDYLRFFVDHLSTPGRPHHIRLICGHSLSVCSSVGQSDTSIQVTWSLWTNQSPALSAVCLSVGRDPTSVASYKSIRGKQPEPLQKHNLLHWYHQQWTRPKIAFYFVFLMDCLTQLGHGHFLRIWA